MKAGERVDTFCAVHRVAAIAAVHVRVDKPWQDVWTSRSDAELNRFNPLTEAHLTRPNAFRGNELTR